MPFLDVLESVDEDVAGLHVGWLDLERISHRLAILRPISYKSLLHMGLARLYTIFA
jgi:hypothetical protein